MIRNILNIFPQTQLKLKLRFNTSTADIVEGNEVMLCTIFEMFSSSEIFSNRNSMIYLFEMNSVRLQPYTE